jgi:hypothetical protein
MGFAARDIMIGGDGVDGIHDTNDNSDDILISGASPLEPDGPTGNVWGMGANDVTLLGLLTGWQSTDPFATRVSVITASNLLPTAIDGEGEQLRGNQLNNNLFHAGTEDLVRTTGPGDQIVRVQPPEVEVRQNGTVVIDNTGSIAFGTTSSGNPINITLTVHNLGTGPLLLPTSQITVPTGFMIVMPPATTVAAGGQTSLVVSLNATAGGGTFSGQLSLGTNDLDEGIYNFALSGTVIAQPDIELRDIQNNVLATGSGVIDFGSTFINEPLTRQLQIVNTGASTLTLSNFVFPTGISLVTTLPSSIVAGGTASVTLQLNASAVSNIDSTASLVNSDPDENPYTISVRGTVLPRPPEIDIAEGAVSIADGTGILNFGTTVAGDPVVTTSTLMTSIHPRALVTFLQRRIQNPETLKRS